MVLSMSQQRESLVRIPLNKHAFLPYFIQLQLKAWLSLER